MSKICMLKIYQNYTFFKVPDGPGGLDLGCFPDDHELPFQYMRTSLILAIRMAVLRSLADSTIGYGIIARYRTALLW